MSKRKLNYRFHNPNTVEETADLLYKVFLKANEDKVERKIREVSSKVSNNDEYIIEGRPA